MKRANYLFAQIAELNNLYLAFWKAKKGKQGKKEVLVFEERLEEHLQGMRQELLKGEVSFGNYHFFTIYDPKERTICASSFRERVLQHALMNVCHPVFERYQIHDSYACRVGKGTYAALDRAKQFAAQYHFFAKLDVRHFFETLDHAVLKRLLKRLFKEKKLIDVFSQIIDSYQTAEGKGVPIGNLSSQYFANHFLAVADHYAKEELKCRAYVRYMDDMVVWGRDLPSLNDQVKRLTGFLEDELQCGMKPPVINHQSMGLPFLGYVVYPHRIGLAKRSRKRFRKKCRAMLAGVESGDISQSEFQRKFLPMLAFVQKADAFRFQQKIMETLYLASAVVGVFTNSFICW